ncbi:MAG: hypothetical protein GF400_07190, partial [Candidatus Eisenbacteria bacterium]|nr:hypothetical protein [Candidatus Eisenbacteria bacterium]
MRGVRVSVRSGRSAGGLPDLQGKERSFHPVRVRSVDRLPGCQVARGRAGRSPRVGQDHLDDAVVVPRRALPVPDPEFDRVQVERYREAHEGTRDSPASRLEARSGAVTAAARPRAADIRGGPLSAPLGWLRRAGSRVWAVAHVAARRAIEERAPEAAASVGFFAVFSFFPLLLILVAVSGFVLADTHTQDQILSSVLRFLPVSRELVSANMRTVLNARGAVGFIGAATLLWSATSAFTVLVNNLN